MDPTQLKATYEQTQFLSGRIEGVDKDLFQTQSHQNVEGLKSQQQQTQNILDSQERAQYANENRQNRNFTLLSDGIKDQGSGIRDSIYRTNAMTNDYVKSGTGDVKDSVYRTNATTNDYVKSGTGDIKDSVYRTNAVTNDYVKTGTAENLLATERTASRLDQEIFRINADIDQNIYRSQAAINDAISATRIEAQKNTNELIGYMKTNNDNNWSNFGNLTKDIFQGKAETILSGTNQYALLAKQASDTSAVVQIEALKNKADLYKQASDNTAAIQLEAMKNKADLSKQMAFEYSSLKDKISDSESNIKDVLRDQESCRLRDVLRATEHKSLYFELKNNHHHGHRRRHH